MAEECVDKWKKTNFHLGKLSDCKVKLTHTHMHVHMCTHTHTHTYWHIYSLTKFNITLENLTSYNQNIYLKKPQIKDN